MPEAHRPLTPLARWRRPQCHPFASGVSASSFALVADPTVSGLSVASLTGGAARHASASLSLAFTEDFSAPATLAVRVLAAALRPTPQTGYNHPIVHTTAGRRRNDETANP